MLQLSAPFVPVFLLFLSCIGLSLPYARLSIFPVLTLNSKEIFSQSVIEGEEAFIEYYSEMRIRETERALEGDLFEKYGLDTKVTLLCEKQTEQVAGKYPSDKIKIKEIRVKLKKSSNEEVLKKMWEYLTKNYCSEVLIE